MSVEFDPPRRRGWLKIELRSQIAESGELRSARVYCPPRDRSITLDECAACSHCTGCVIDSGSKDWLLRCERALDPNAPAADGASAAEEGAPIEAPPQGAPKTDA